MEQPATATWGLRISSTDLEKLQRGFQPHDMEDRWQCLADTPDERGNITVHWIRRWTGSKEIMLQVKRLNDSDGAEIAQIKWNKGTGATELDEAAAKRLATQLCHGILETEKWDI
jgi:hypothetical protein